MGVLEAIEKLPVHVHESAGQMLNLQVSPRQRNMYSVYMYMYMCMERSYQSIPNGILTAQKE